MQRRRYNNRQSHPAGAKPTVSKCGDHTVRGYPSQIAEKYKQLADEAEDPVARELFRQHEEHYRRGE